MVGSGGLAPATGGAGDLGGAPGGAGSVGLDAGMDPIDSEPDPPDPIGDGGFDSGGPIAAGGTSSAGGAASSTGGTSTTGGTSSTGGASSSSGGTPGAGGSAAGGMSGTGGSGNPSHCLSDWRTTSCADQCTMAQPPQPDIRACSIVLDCWLDHDCGPDVDCPVKPGSQDRFCSPNDLQKGGAPYGPAELVWDCLVCP
jgi:hypothetical protein